MDTESLAIETALPPGAPLEPEAPATTPEAAQVRYAVDQMGAFIGVFVGAELPAGAVQVPSAPSSIQQRWDGSAWCSTVAAEAELTDLFVSAVSGYMDKAARMRRYDGILSLCTYATSTDAVFAAEGQAGVDFRDACWRYCYDALAEVKAGKRAAPSVQAFLAELPALSWPAQAVPA